MHFTVCIVAPTVYNRLKLKLTVKCMYIPELLNIDAVGSISKHAITQQQYRSILHM